MSTKASEPQGMTLLQKLLEVKRSVDWLKKEAQNDFEHFKYTPSSQVLASVRDKMNDLGVLLESRVIKTLFHPKEALGQKQHLTEVWFYFVWIDVDSGEERKVPWYAQGTDSGERGVGKAMTYAEKFFILKQFNIPTDEADPDSTKSPDEKGSKPAGKPTEAPQNPASAPQGHPTNGGSQSTRRPRRQQRQGNTGSQGKPETVNDKEQQARGCINSTLILELRDAVIKQDKANLLDITADFAPWLEEYLDALYDSLQRQGATVKRKHKGTAHLLRDIPSSAYKEILERVQKEPKTCRAGYERAVQQEAEQGVDIG